MNEWKQSGLSGCPLLSPEARDYVTLNGKRDSASVTKDMDLEMNDNPGLARWTRPHHVDPEKWRTFPDVNRETMQTQKEESSVLLLALKTKAGVMSQGCRFLWKLQRQGNKFYSQTPSAEISLTS